MPANSSCTQLTEDDHVFVSISPVFPDCYQQTHDTPVIAGSLPGALPASSAPDFAFIPPDAPFDAVQLAAVRQGRRLQGQEGRRSSTAPTSDAPEVAAVQADLKKLHVAGAPDGRGQRAVDRHGRVRPGHPDHRAQRFQSAGVNVVIGVGGSGSTTWPRAQVDLQSTYKPTYIATSESSFISYVESTKGANPYLDDVLAATSAPTAYQQWKDPAIQKCAAEVHKAYPSDTITPPVNPDHDGARANDTTYQSVIEACQYLALFDEDRRRGWQEPDRGQLHQGRRRPEERRHSRASARSPSAPGQPYAVGPVTIVHYDPQTQTLVPDTSLK